MPHVPELHNDSYDVTAQTPPATPPSRQTRIATPVQHRLGSPSCTRLETHAPCALVCQKFSFAVWPCRVQLGDPRVATTVIIVFRSHDRLSQMDITETGCDLRQAHAHTHYYNLAQVHEAPKQGRLSPEVGIGPLDLTIKMEAHLALFFQIEFFEERPVHTNQFRHIY